jgi:hypothetical protein
MTADVELSDEMFIITKETADAYLKTRVAPPVVITPPRIDEKELPIIDPPLGNDQSSLTKTSTVLGLTWMGEIPHLKWMNFYTKVLSKFASTRGLKLTLKVEFGSEGGVSQQKLDETKSALRELGLNDDVAPK